MKKKVPKTFEDWTTSRILNVLVLDLIALDGSVREDDGDEDDMELSYVTDGLTECETWMVSDILN